MRLKLLRELNRISVKSTILAQAQALPIRKGGFINSLGVPAGSSWMAAAFPVVLHWICPVTRKKIGETCSKCRLCHEVTKCFIIIDLMLDWYWFSNDFKTLRTCAHD